MSDGVQDFLKKIGPRPLTHEEARQLEILRIKAGKPSGISGVIERLAAEARAEEKAEAEADADAAREKESGGED